MTNNPAGPATKWRALRAMNFRCDWSIYKIAAPAAWNENQRITLTIALGLQLLGFVHRL